MSCCLSVTSLTVKQYLVNLVNAFLSQIHCPCLTLSPQSSCQAFLPYIYIRPILGCPVCHCWFNLEFKIFSKCGKMQPQNSILYYKTGHRLQQNTSLYRAFQIKIFCVLVGAERWCKKALISGCWSMQPGSHRTWTLVTAVLKCILWDRLGEGSSSPPDTVCSFMSKLLSVI